MGYKYLNSSQPPSRISSNYIINSQWKSVDNLKTFSSPIKAVSHAVVTYDFGTWIGSHFIQTDVKQRARSNVSVSVKSVHLTFTPQAAAESTGTYAAAQ